MSEKPPTKMVKLASGGLVTLKVSVDFFKLSKADRTFVLDLIATLEEYEGAWNPVADDEENE